MDILLFDHEEVYNDLLPLSFTRPVSLFRVGITPILEKWSAMVPGRYTLRPVDYLREVYYNPDSFNRADSLYIASNYLPNPVLAAAVIDLKPGQSLKSGEILVAYRGSLEDFESGQYGESVEAPQAERICFAFDIFRCNHNALTADYYRLIEGRHSRPLSKSNIIIGDYCDSEGRPQIFLEEGAVVEGAIINVKDGPVYVGKDAEVMEGACLRGPVALCHNAKIKMGGKVYGATTLGPYCKVGGELSNVVMFGYSNKAHEGYLGNAVIGEWCNIGAGSSASNLKNDYTRIRIWNYPRHSFMRTDLQFCGLIMADHSKAGINCMFNTATVLGVGVNIHGSGFPRTFIPSFSEGSPAGGFKDVSLKKFFEIAERVMGRRGKTISASERKIYEHAYAYSQKYK